VPPGLPPVLQELMMAALAKDPKNRWVFGACYLSQSTGMCMYGSSLFSFCCGYRIGAGGS
jgi:hypothetical protein